MSKLAIGVAIDSIEELSNWEAKLLADILADSRFELRDIVENRSPAKTAAPLALRLLQRGEQMVFARNTSSLAREVKSQLLRITADKGSAYSGVDIFIRLTADALPRRVLDRTRLGELSLDFVDRKTAGYDWAGFREVRNGSPFTKVVVNFRASAGEPPQRSPAHPMARNSAQRSMAHSSRRSRSSFSCANCAGSPIAAS